jgi:hypothetical protein
VYNQPLQFKKVMRHVGEPMPHEESVASAAVSTMNSLGTNKYFLIYNINEL